MFDERFVRYLHLEIDLQNPPTIPLFSFSLSIKCLVVNTITHSLMLHKSQMLIKRPNVDLICFFFKLHKLCFWGHNMFVLNSLFSSHLYNFHHKPNWHMSTFYQINCFALQMTICSLFCSGLLFHIKILNPTLSNSVILLYHYTQWNMRRPSEDITEKIISLKLIAIKFTKLCQFIQLIIIFISLPWN